MPPVAVNVPVPSPSRLMPSFALVLELTSSNASVAPLVALTSTAGPPVALMLAVPVAGTDTLPALLRRKPVPPVVVSERSPNVVDPGVGLVGLVMLTPPVAEPVTLIASNVLVPMLVFVAVRPGAPALAIVIVLAGVKLTVPALLSSTPVALLLTVKLLMLNVPVVPLSSSPGCVPVVPVSLMLTSSIVAPPVSPVRAGDAAAGALGVDVEAADLVAVVEVDDVGVGGGERRVRARIRRVEVLGPERSAAVWVDLEALVFADQPLAGGHGVAVAAVAGGRVVSVEYEHGVVGGRGRLGFDERVERCRRRAAAARRRVVADVPDAAGDLDRHAAGVGLLG